MERKQYSLYSKYTILDGRKSEAGRYHVELAYSLALPVQNIYDNMGDATQNKSMKSSFFQVKKRTRVLSEPESSGIDNEIQSQTDTELPSTAPQIRILQRDESRAATDNGANVGASDINATGIQNNQTNFYVDADNRTNGTLGATENNQNNLNVTNISDNESRETFITNPVYAEREREILTFRLVA